VFNMSFCSSVCCLMHASVDKLFVLLVFPVVPSLLKSTPVTASAPSTRLFNAPLGGGSYGTIGGRSSTFDDVAAGGGDGGRGVSTGPFVNNN
jgi:hypothetical protein